MASMLALAAFSFYAVMLLILLLSALVMLLTSSRCRMASKSPLCQELEGGTLLPSADLQLLMRTLGHSGIFLPNHLSPSTAGSIYPAVLLHMEC